MAKKIEEAFNDCFERLLLGESLESCVSSYPEYTAELHIMLHTAFDVRRRTFPVQARPEFKYRSRIRMQGVQDYVIKQHRLTKATSLNMRRNLAISLATILVFVLATGGTAAASYAAMPDQPLYGVKLAVEQAQVTLTPSETTKAEMYAKMAEKRAGEIAVMSAQGKTDKVLSVTHRMYEQLDLAEQLMATSEAEISEQKDTPQTTSTTAPSISAPSGATGTPPPAVTPSSNVAPPKSSIIDQLAGSQSTSASKQQLRTTAALTKAKTSINDSNAKTLTILQGALDKAPDNMKTHLNAAIERTKKSHEKLNPGSSPDLNQKPSSSGSVSANSDGERYQDDSKTGADTHSTVPDRSKGTSSKDLSSHK